MKKSFIENSSYNINFSDYILTPEEDALFMANIDMEAVEKGIRKSKEEFNRGQGIDFKDAMFQIHKEVFGEEL